MKSWKLCCGCVKFALMNTNTSRGSASHFKYKHDIKLSLALLFIHFFIIYGSFQLQW